MQTQQVNAKYIQPAIPVRGDVEHRCPDCNRLLMKGQLAPGSSVQTKCQCKRLVTLARM